MVSAVHPAAALQGESLVWGHLPLAGDFPTRQRCCGWPARCWSRRTTNGRSPDRRYLSDASMALLNRPAPTEEVAQPALVTP
jgi:hypothetical protein